MAGVLSRTSTIHGIHVEREQIALRMKFMAVTGLGVEARCWPRLLFGRLSMEIIDGACMRRRGCIYFAFKMASFHPGLKKPLGSLGTHRHSCPTSNS